MMAKPTRALELHYPMIQFLIIIVFRIWNIWGSLKNESSFVHDTIIHGQLKNNDKNRTKVTKNHWWKSLFGVIDFTFLKIESSKI